MKKKWVLLRKNERVFEKERTTPSTFSRIIKFSVARLGSIALALAVGIFVVVLITNLGGFVDSIYQDRIGGAIGTLARALAQEVPTRFPEEIHAILDQTQWYLEEEYGLHEPFLKRCVKWWQTALTFDWGESDTGLTTLWGPKKTQFDTQLIVLTYLPNTLLLFGAGNLFAFFASVFVALLLSRRLGSWIDRIFIALTPLYSAPAWVYGAILIVIIGAQNLDVLFGVLYDIHYGELAFSEITLLSLRIIAIPALAIFISVFFQGVYTWRTFFALHVNEDYVEMAEAQGLPSRTIQRKYLLRPTLPAIITSFAMMVVTFWQGMLALEYSFSWPGIGGLFVRALQYIDRGVMLSIIVLFAYLMAITVFLLDIIHAVLDPRVRIGSDGNSVAPQIKRRFRWFKRKENITVFSREKTSRKHQPRSFAWRIKRQFSFLKQSLSRMKPVIRELKRYPSAVVGIVVILVLIIASIYVVIAIPYDEAVRMWRAGTLSHYKVPKMAPPEWVNLFRKDDLPSTIVLNTYDGSASKEIIKSSKGMNEYDIWFEFEYDYAEFPQDVYFLFDTSYAEKMPFVFLTWITPEGKEIELHQGAMASDKFMSLSWPIREELQNAFGGEGGDPMRVLFSDSLALDSQPIQGTYRLHLEGLTFEEGRDINAELVVLGLVHGLGGTDEDRHDLMFGLLWGLPIALAFGIIGAVGTSLVQMFLAGVSAWFGGWVDGLIQRITEVNILIPVLPMALTLYYLFGKTIWHILGIIVLLSIFSSDVKNYRAIFLQAKEDPYVEAAKAYGASNFRIIFKYLVPRIIPMLVPRLLLLVPGYVFLEATLAYLGVGDLYIPTWGKLIRYAIDALSSVEGHSYLVLEPLVFLLVLGFSFAMLGIALERILNPRLQDK